MTAAVTDFTQFTELRASAGRDEQAALREVAGQFEALFLQMMLESMRDASMGDPLLGDSNQRDLYQGMFDQQIAAEMASGKGIGLADVLVRQLGGEPAQIPERRVSAPKKPAWDSPESFARDVWPHAQRVASELNVPAEGVLAQAALETGWGQHVMARGDGGTSFNLFGIKATGGWNGDAVAHRTLEFADGMPRQEVARFRAYDDVGATFSDYAELIGNNPRYGAVRDQGTDVAGFAGALADAGYATDPEYAAKISRVAGSETMQRVLADLKNSPTSPIAE